MTPVLGETAGRVRPSAGFILDLSGKIQLHLFLCTITDSVTYLEFLKDLKDAENFSSQRCYIFLGALSKLARDITTSAIAHLLKARGITSISYMLDELGRHSEQSFH